VRLRASAAKNMVRNRVVTTVTPGMAADKAAQGQITTARSTMTL
jgi:hypothetical protein